MKNRVASVAVVLARLVVAYPAGAAQVGVTDAWFRALPSNLPAGGYFTLHNTGGHVQLTGAQSSACGMLMLHKSTESGGMSEMMMMANVDIPAGGILAFSPGGYHLMCTNPTGAMMPGAHVPVTLNFSDGTKANVVFAVRNANGK